MHLQYGSYYQNVCYKYLELNKINRIRDIEETTFENFENAKYMLQCEGKDTPVQRLNETKNNLTLMRIVNKLNMEREYI